MIREPFGDSRMVMTNEKKATGQLRRATQVSFWIWHCHFLQLAHLHSYVAYPFQNGGTGNGGCALRAPESAHRKDPSPRRFFRERRVARDFYVRALPVCSPRETGVDSAGEGLLVTGGRQCGR